MGAAFESFHAGQLAQHIDMARAASLQAAEAASEMTAAYEEGML